MRLLNVHNHALECFADEDAPPYAILSHCWSVDEVSFQDLKDGIGRQKAAYTKIEASCRIASLTVSYVWIDTCCIDKSSSAEVSEAINCMYRWYSNATICYAYLFDVCLASGERNRATIVLDSVWFTRGWTLQELIAPSKLVFYDCTWTMLGTKLQFAPEITALTGIPNNVIVNRSSSLNEPAAAVFSWAASRKTTRIEDRAYSLLGLLGINMPLLYGEGFKAFHRLQETLLSTRDDTSILGWSETTDLASPVGSIFATSPSDYGEVCRTYRPLSHLWQTTSMNGIRLGNMGLSMQIFMVPISYHVYIVPLVYTGHQGRQVLREGMMVERSQDGLFRRLVDAGRNSMFKVPDFEDWQYRLLDITIARDVVHDLSDMRLRPSPFKSVISPIDPSYTQYSVVMNKTSLLSGRLDDTSHGVKDVIRIPRSSTKTLHFVLGLDAEFIPFCLYIPIEHTSHAIHDSGPIVLRSALDITRNYVIGKQRDMMHLVNTMQYLKVRHENSPWGKGIELLSMPKTHTNNSLQENESTFWTADGVKVTLSLVQKSMESMILELGVAIYLPTYTSDNCSFMHEQTQDMVLEGLAEQDIDDDWQWIT